MAAAPCTNWGLSSHSYQKAVVFPFFANLAGDAVAGEDTVVVGECEHARLEFFYQRGVVATGEVGTANAEMEEGVTGEDSLVGRHHIAHAPRAMSGDIAALDCCLSHPKGIVVVDFLHFEISHIINGKTHDVTVCLSLVQQFDPFLVHGDKQVVVLAHLPQARDMVDMGVGEQHHDRREAFHLDKLHQLRVFERGLTGWVHNGALLRRLIDNHVCINLEVVECKLLNHKPFIIVQNAKIVIFFSIIGSSLSKN